MIPLLEKLVKLTEKLLNEVEHLNKKVTVIEKAIQKLSDDSDKPKAPPIGK